MWRPTGTSRPRVSTTKKVPKTVTVVTGKGDLGTDYDRLGPTVSTELPTPYARIYAGISPDQTAISLHSVALSNPTRDTLYKLQLLKIQVLAKDVLSGQTNPTTRGARRGRRHREAHRRGERLHPDQPPDHVVCRRSSNEHRVTCPSRSPSTAPGSSRWGWTTPVRRRGPSASASDDYGPPGVIAPGRLPLLGHRAGQDLGQGHDV